MAAPQNNLLFSLEMALTLTSLQPQTLSSHPAMSAASELDASCSLAYICDSTSDHRNPQRAVFRIEQPAQLSWCFVLPVRGRKEPTIAAVTHGFVPFVLGES